MAAFADDRNEGRAIGMAGQEDDDNLPDGFIIDDDADSYVIDFGKCMHGGQIIDGCCMHCNEQIERPRISAGATARISAKRPPIMDVLEKYPYSDAIKTKACEIFVSLKLTNLRDVSKRMALCYCIFQAHAVKGLHTVPFLIGKTLGLTRSQTFKAMSKFSANGNNSNYRADGYMDPVELVAVYADQFGLSDELTINMKEDFRHLLEIAPHLIDRPACTLVAAYMWYYLDTISGIKIDENKFAAIFLLKFGTIKSVHAEISRIDNS